MTTKGLAKRLLKWFWRRGQPMRRPLARKFHGLIDAKVFQLELALSEKIRVVPPEMQASVRGMLIERDQELLRELHAIFRSVMVDLEHIERRLDEIQFAQRHDVGAAARE